MKQTLPAEEPEQIYEYGESLTFEQARALGEELGRALDGNAELIGDLLLAFRALAMRDERTEILSELTNGLLPFCPGAGALMNRLIATRSKEFERRIPNRK